MNNLQVISASRRTDVVMHYAPWLAQAIRNGKVEVVLPYGRGIRQVSLLPQDVHTLVLWSKDYRHLLEDEAGLRSALSCYDQVYCHLTITGLGGSRLEPAIPPWDQVADQLAGLVEFLGDPRRITVRYDPIVHWFEDGRILSNLEFAEPILERVSRAGVTTVRISFAALYAKVRRRKGWDWFDPPLEQKLQITNDLVCRARSRGITMYACSQAELGAAGALPSHCIDGELLSRLHPFGLPAKSGKDSGQRAECGCSPSVDIGSYSMSCPSGCRYCYANPKFS